MDNLNAKKAALEAKLRELEQALGQAMRDLQTARADPMRRIAAHECYEKIWAERERVRAELLALEAQATAQSTPKRRGKKVFDGDTSETAGPNAA